MHPWPADVDPPHALAWQPSAARWLARIAPDCATTPDVLALAHAAHTATRGALDAARAAWIAAPADLAGLAPPAAIGDLRGRYANRGRQLARLLEEVTAVRDALIRDAHHARDIAARGRREPPDGGAWRRGREG